MAAAAIGIAISVPLLTSPSPRTEQVQRQKAASAQKEPENRKNSVPVASSFAVGISPSPSADASAQQLPPAGQPGRADTLYSLPDVHTTDWNLILVNPTHPLPEGYAPTTRELAGGIYDTAVYTHYQYFCDERIFDDLTAMLTDCTAAGFHPLVASGYREHATQITLFQDNIAALEARGLSREDAEKETRTVVAVPGTSEHELGLAVDIACEENTELDATQLDTPTQKWLMDNSWHYGFVVRYPTDKTSQTDIIFEPWHYRYVGKESARYMHNHNLCLEEYIDRLQKHEKASSSGSSGKGNRKNTESEEESKEESKEESAKTKEQK
jgi:LAS superfamily LD-carboxypeptidase LdcB